MNDRLWPESTDAAQVERLIPAIQAAGASAHEERNGTIEVSAPDLANALLVVLASVLEGSPIAATPAGIRQLADWAARELRNLMKVARRPRHGDAST